MCGRGLEEGFFVVGGVCLYGCMDWDEWLCVEMMVVWVIVICFVFGVVVGGLFLCGDVCLFIGEVLFVVFVVMVVGVVVVVVFFVSMLMYCCGEMILMLWW